MANYTPLPQSLKMAAVAPSNPTSPVQHISHHHKGMMMTLTVFGLLACAAVSYLYVALPRGGAVTEPFAKKSVPTEATHGVSAPPEAQMMPPPPPSSPEAGFAPATSQTASASAQFASAGATLATPSAIFTLTPTVTITKTASKSARIVVTSASPSASVSP